MQSHLRKIPVFFSSLYPMLALVWQTNPLYCSGLIFLIVLQGSAPLINAWITKLLFDLLGRSLSAGQAVDWPGLARLLLFQVFLMMVGQAIGPVLAYLNSELGRSLTLKIQKIIYEKINSFAGIAYFENPAMYDTIRLAQQGAQQSSGSMLGTMVSFIQNAVTLVSFVGVLLVFSPALVAVVALAALPQLYAQLKFGQQRFGLASQISSQERQKFFYSFLLSSPLAAKEMRLFDIAGYFLDKVLNLYRSTQQAERQQQVTELRWRLLVGVVSSLAGGAAFVIVAIEAFASRFSLGDITLYLNAVASVQAALGNIVYAISALNENALFFQYFARLMALPQPLPVPVSPQPVGSLVAGLELRDVSFRYSEQHPWVLRHVNLFIPAGQCLALVGLNGAGKTTVVKLLARFYDPTEGQILWDGKDIRDLSPRELRRRMGAVFQDFVHYDLSARENIGIGDIRYVDDLERIHRAAGEAGVHERIERLPQGYQTQISLMFGDDSEAGVELSGGEWQKIAIARLCMRDADLLILDEPTSALDAQAEYETYQHFARLVNGRTALLITHRFSTVRMANKIAVLSDGQIVEYGSHDELVQSAGAYAKLYQMQAERYT